MRDILFRGRSTQFNLELCDQDDWVYGSLLTKGCECYIFSDRGGVIQVCAETVGQFINRYDSEGTKIYEGDLVLVEDEENERELIGKVATYECFEPGFDVYIPSKSWAIGFENFSNEINAFMDHDLRKRVVGNIHENAELLK